MSGEPGRLVVIGGGQAGLQLAGSVRTIDPDIHVTVVSEEPSLPYQRPPLSKAFLLDKIGESALWLQPERFFAQKRITVLTGTRVARIDRSTRQIVLADNRMLPYDQLVLATGSRPRRLPSAEHLERGVFYLRDLDDARQLKVALAQAPRVLVVGGGFIGLEFAAVARSKGLVVDVIEAGPRLMARATSAPISGFFESVHSSRGVSVGKTVAVEQWLHRDGRFAGATLSNGKTLHADLVLIGIGAVANDDLAAEAGLRTADGICVDAGLRTTDPRIHAIGDCARVHSADGNFRMESVQNAIDQARHVARSLNGSTDPYRALPWFWSDQYEWKLQIAGLPQDIDESVVRGRASDGKFSVYHFRRRELISVESVNQPAAHVVSRLLLDQGSEVRPDHVRDADLDLRRFIPTAAAPLPAAH